MARVVIKCALLIILATILLQDNIVFANNLFFTSVYNKKIPLNVRNGPGKHYPAINNILKKHTLFQLKHKIENWCFVESYDNQISGWSICNAFHKNTNLTVTLNKIHLFRQKHTDKQIIATIDKYTKVKVLKCSIDLDKCNVIVIKNNITGWIDAHFLWGFGKNKNHLR